MAFEIVWEARTPVFDYRDCLAPLPPSLAGEHYEQSGRVKGTLRLPGRTCKFKGTGHRDHSWGVRHWEGFRSWAAFMGRLGDDLFFHVEQFDEQTTGVTCHGFVSYAGENVPLRNADIDRKSVGQEPFLRHFGIRLEDLRGKTLAMKGEVQLACPLQIGKCLIEESLGVFSWSGVSKRGVVEYGFVHE